MASMRNARLPELSELGVVLVVGKARDTRISRLAYLWLTRARKLACSPVRYAEVDDVGAGAV